MSAFEEGMDEYCLLLRHTEASHPDETARQLQQRPEHVPTAIR